MIWNNDNKVQKRLFVYVPSPTPCAFLFSALCPHGAADTSHVGQRPQAESSGNAPHDHPLEETGIFLSPNM